MHTVCSCFFGGECWIPFNVSFGTSAHKSCNINWHSPFVLQVFNLTAKKCCSQIGAVNDAILCQILFCRCTVLISEGHLSGFSQLSLQMFTVSCGGITDSLTKVVLKPMTHILYKLLFKSKCIKLIKSDFLFWITFYSSKNLETMLWFPQK